MCGDEQAEGVFVSTFDGLFRLFGNLEFQLEIRRQHTVVDLT